LQEQINLFEGELFCLKDETFSFYNSHE